MGNAVNALTCGIGSLAAIGPDSLATFSGGNFSIQVGQSSLFGGIATTLILQANGIAANVIEDRSGTGAAWQNSSLLYDPGQNQLIVFNQAVGNAAGMQWGYNNSMQSLSAQGWNVLYSDHTHPNFSTQGFASMIPNNPCAGDGYSFDFGKGSIAEAPLATSAGSAIQLTYSYDYLAGMDQSWGTWDAEQAFYMDRNVASLANLRVYLHGSSGWAEGPISPTSAFSIQNNGGTPTNCQTGSCIGPIANDLAYAVLVWNIGGLDIGMAIPGAGFGTELDKLDSVYCADASNPSCGSLAWHTWIEKLASGNFSAGQDRHYQVQYTIGTLEQLAELGFQTTTASRLPASSAAYALGSAASNDALWPAANAIDGDPTTAYSSQPFASTANDRGTFLAAWLANGPQAVNTVELGARVALGQVQAFPATYQVYLTSADNSQWLLVGTYSNQPDTSGKVLLSLGASYSTYGVMIVPTALGLDSFENAYFQLADIGLAQN
jgi:hypothetical protein